MKSNNGWLYIFSNPLMPGFYKIGLTTTGIESRLKSLSGTAVPIPFTCIYSAETSEAYQLESFVHRSLEHMRFSGKREFFTFVSDESAIAMLTDVVDRFRPKPPSEKEKRKLSRVDGPAQIAKDAGNESVAGVGRTTKTASSTLYDMANLYPLRYRAICLGAAIMKTEKEQ